MTARALPTRPSTTAGRHRDGHRIRVLVAEGALVLEADCPFSPDWDAADQQPDGPPPGCRQARAGVGDGAGDPWPTRTCQVVDGVRGLGAEVLTIAVDDDLVVDGTEPEHMPITREWQHAEYWWGASGHDLYVRPVPLLEQQRIELIRCHPYCDPSPDWRQCPEYFEEYVDADGEPAVRDNDLDRCSHVVDDVWDDDRLLELITATTAIRAAAESGEPLSPAEILEALDGVQQACPAPPLQASGIPILATPQRLSAPDQQQLVDAVVGLGRLSLDFGLVERRTLHPDGRTLETDTTHTVMLGLIGCALAHRCFPQLDAGLVAQYALVHDLVEVYAGDTPTLRLPTAEARAAKQRREQEAFDRIAAEFGATLPWLSAAIRSYEHRAAAEARYIRALDKLLPKIAHLLNGAATVHAEGLDGAELAARYQTQAAELETYAGDFPQLLALRALLVDQLLNVVATRQKNAPAAAELAAQDALDEDAREASAMDEQAWTEAEEWERAGRPHDWTPITETTAEQGWNEQAALASDEQHSTDPLPHPGDDGDAQPPADVASGPGAAAGSR